MPTFLTHFFVLAMPYCGSICLCKLYIICAVSSNRKADFAFCHHEDNASFFTGYHTACRPTQLFQCSMVRLQSGRYRSYDVTNPESGHSRQSQHIVCLALITGATQRAESTPGVWLSVTEPRCVLRLNVCSIVHCSYIHTYIVCMYSASRNSFAAYLRRVSVDVSLTVTGLSINEGAKTNSDFTTIPTYLPLQPPPSPPPLLPLPFIFMF